MWWDLWNESGILRHLWNEEEDHSFGAHMWVCLNVLLILGVPVDVVWLLYKELQPLNTEKDQTTSSEVVFWKQNRKNQGLKTSSDTNRNTKPPTTICQPGRQPDTRHLQFSPPWDSRLEQGIKKQTTPNTLHTRLNWRRNQTSGFGLETAVALPSGPAPPDSHG